ncbi:hypothetical protein ACFW2D_20725 [Streptomyces sp. NPDC058914]|uniref:hypothetical protein n=1 Tax=Streptomyces TaxID=1883 RepID=UPI0036BE38F3
MPSEPDKRPDPAAASVSLAAEAAVLESRLRLLQEAIDTVDARIEAVSDALRLLRHASAASSRAPGGEEACRPLGREDADGSADDTGGKAARRSMP